MRFLRENSDCVKLFPSINLLSMNVRYCARIARSLNIALERYGAAAAAADLKQLLDKS
jgi:hypothetical protein